MKHSAFEEERERRLVLTLLKKPVPTVDGSVRLRMIAGQLAPYVPLSWVLLKRRGQWK